MRRLGSVQAQRVGTSLDRYVETGHGDVKPIIDSAEGEQRLRVGKIRLFFIERDDVLEVTGVLPRDKAYRAREVPVPFGTSEATVQIHAGANA
jgi:hypothetical protein